MQNYQRNSPQKILEKYKILLALESNVKIIPLDPTTTEVSPVYIVLQSNKEKLFLKIFLRDGDYNREIYFLKFLEGSIPLPNIINMVSPSEHHHGAILMTFFEGEHPNSSNLTQNTAFSIGAILARIHIHQCENFGDLTTPSSLKKEAFSHFGEKFQEGMDECKNHLPASLLKECEEYYRLNHYLLSSVDGPCIIHRDFRPANILVNNNNVSGILDWSSARASFAEQDFCPFEHEEWPKGFCKSSFLEGYSSIRPLPQYASIMPLLKINRALATVGFALKTNSWTSSYKHAYLFNRKFLENFFEKRSVKT